MTAALYSYAFHDDLHQLRGNVVQLTSTSSLSASSWLTDVDYVEQSLYSKLVDVQSSGDSTPSQGNTLVTADDILAGDITSLTDIIASEMTSLDAAVVTSDDSSEMLEGADLDKCLVQLLAAGVEVTDFSATAETVVENEAELLPLATLSCSNPTMPHLFSSDSSFDCLSTDGAIDVSYCTSGYSPSQTSTDSDDDFLTYDRTKRSVHLWQFLKELLMSPSVYRNAIRWLDQQQGIFKIENSAFVAKLWGRRKNRPAMNYDKLSRSIRQYYRKGIIRKTNCSRRLVYQFCPQYL